MRLILTLLLLISSSDVIAEQPLYTLSFETQERGVLAQTEELKMRAFEQYAPKLLVEENILVAGKLKFFVREVARAQVLVKEFESTLIEDDTYLVKATVSIKDYSMDEYKELLTHAKKMALQHKVRKERPQFNASLNAKSKAIEKEIQAIESERQSLCKERLAALEELLAMKLKNEGYISKELLDKEKALQKQCDTH